MTPRETNTPGTDRLEARTEAYLDRAAGDLADRPVRTAGKFLGIGIGIVIVLSVIFGAVSFIGSWGNEAKKVVSPANVTTQYREVIEGYESLKAAAINACGAKNAKPDANSPSLVEDPSFAYAAQYRSIAVIYNRRQHNLFEAKLVGPKGYPSTAPSLAEMQAEVC